MAIQFELQLVGDIQISSTVNLNEAWRWKKSFSLAL